MKRGKKIFGGILAVVILTVLLCGIQYMVYFWSHPAKKTANFSDKGCLFSNEGRSCDVVEVQIERNEFHYVFGNDYDYIEGDIQVGGYRLYTGDTQKGFTVMFSRKSSEQWAVFGSGSSNVAGKILYTVRNGEVYICLVDDMSKISDAEEGSKGILIVPAKDRSAAESMIRTAAKNSEDISKWLLDNGYEEYAPSFFSSSSLPINYQLRFRPGRYEK